MGEVGKCQLMVLSYMWFARWDGDVGHHSPLPALSTLPWSSFSCFPLGIRLLVVLAFSSAVLARLCSYLAFVLGKLMTLKK